MVEKEVKKMTPTAQKILECINNRLGEFSVDMPNYYEERDRIFRELLTLVERQREALTFVSASVPNMREPGMSNDEVIEQLEFANSTINQDAKCAKRALALTDESLRKLVGGE